MNRADNSLGRREAVVLGLVPALLLGFLLVGNWQSWRSTRELSRQLTLHQCAATAEELALRIDLLLRERAKNLALLSNLWREAPTPGRQDTFLKYAQGLLDPPRRFDLVLYIDDANMMVVTPPARDDANPLSGLDIQSRPAREDLFRTVRKSIAPLDAPPTARLTSKGGLVIWYPVLVDRADGPQVEGTVAGAMYLSDLVRQALTPLIAQEFWVRADVEGRSVHDSGPPPAQASQVHWDLEGEKHLTMLGLDWRVTVWPKGGGGYVKLAPANRWQLIWQVVLSFLASGLLGFALYGLLREHRSRRRLQLSERRYRTLVDSAIDGILVCDQGGRIRDANQAFCRSLGQGREELAGRPLHELVEPELAGELSQRLQRLRRPGRLFWEMSYRDHAGRLVPVEVSARLFEYGGEPAVLAMFRDVSQRKQAMRALAESEERLRAIFQRAAVGILLCAPDNRLLSVNPKLCQITGYSAQELERMGYWDLVHPADRRRVRHLLHEKIAQGETSWSWEERMLRNDGQPVWVNVTTSLMAAGEQPDALYSIDVIEDITERRQLEKQLRQAQKMESIGTLAGGIAHDFNNILGSILGFTQMALVEAPEDSRLRRRLEQVFKAANLAKDLVRQILTFSRRGETEPHPVRIGPVVKETLKFLRASLPSHVQISQDLAPETGTVMADPTQIHQVLMNLCTNAAQALGPRGGRLRVALDQVDLDPGLARPLSLEPGAYLKLSVSDDGMGIPEEYLERIFEPYFTTKAVGEGTGMGLAVVHGIVREHEGAITVHSHPGRGSTFTVYLPQSAAPPEAPAPPGPGLPTGRERVLLVDDETALLEVGRDMLEHLGYGVDTAAGAQQAWDRFASQPGAYDLVIADQTMPGLSGLELARRMLELRPGVAVILCTGYSHSLNLEELRLSGIKSLLLKPLVLEELAPAVRAALGRPAPENPA